MASVSGEDDIQHKSLMIKLCNMMDPNDATYKNFILYLSATIPKGRLSRVQQCPTEVIALMEVTGFLQAGKYQFLEKALEASGYINILDVLKDEGKYIDKQMRKCSYSDGPMADDSSNIEPAIIPQYHGVETSLFQQQQGQLTPQGLWQQQNQLFEHQTGQPLIPNKQYENMSNTAIQYQAQSLQAPRPTVFPQYYRAQPPRGSYPANMFQQQQTPQRLWQQQNQLFGYQTGQLLIPNQQYENMSNNATQFQTQSLQAPNDPTNIPKNVTYTVHNISSSNFVIGDNNRNSITNVGSQKDGVKLPPGSHRSTSNESDMAKRDAMDKQNLYSNKLNGLITEDSCKGNKTWQKTKCTDKLFNRPEQNQTDSAEIGIPRQEQCETHGQDTHTLNQDSIHPTLETAALCHFKAEDIKRVWPSIERELRKELYVKSLLPFFTVKNIMTDDQCQVMCIMRRENMVDILLQIVKENLAVAFPVLLKAVKETRQDFAYNMLVDIINGTHISEIQDMTFKLNVVLKQGEETLIEVEEAIRSTVKNVSRVDSHGVLSLIVGVTRGSVIIYFRSQSKHERETLEEFCQQGEMKNFVLNLLKRKDIHASLPAGKVSIDIQVSCHEEGHSESEGVYQPTRDLVPVSFQIVDDPQVIKENLILQYSILLEETEPLHLQKTFIDRGLLNESFFEELTKLRRRERMDCFLKRLLDIGSEEAILALVDALKGSGDEILAKKLCHVETKTSLHGDTDHVDDSLVKVVEVVPNTCAEEGVFWSCHLEVMIGKDAAGKTRCAMQPTEKGKLHQDVLNRCMIALVRNLDYDLVSMYVQEKEILDDLVLQDIGGLPKRSDKIRELIRKIKQRDEDTYRKFKECLVEAGQVLLKDILEEQEEIAQRCTVSKDKHYTEREEKKSDEGADKKKGHVMISYCWAQKKKAVWIKERLKTYGYPIWIDEEDMGRELLSSMAKAVEEAYVVLLCMSEDYKSSRNCKIEAKYARDKNKIIIPLKMEKLELDEWLGILVTDSIYYNFSENTPSEEEMKKLLRELASYYKKDLNEPEIVPSGSTIVSQEETGPAQDFGDNQSTGSD